MARSVKEMKPGDYVKDDSGRIEKIARVWGIKNRRLVKRFSVITESGRKVERMQARAYYKAGDPEVRGR